MNTLAELSNYDSWANDKTLQALEAVPVGSLPPYLIKVMAHIMSAKSVWLNRILKLPRELPIWPDLTLAECRAWQEKLSKAYPAVVEQNEPSHQEPITYTNSVGAVYSETPQQMLLQALTHGSYHRGQIAREMRLAGLESVYTDYVAMLREVK